MKEKAAAAAEEVKVEMERVEVEVSQEKGWNSMGTLSKASGN